MSSRKLFPLSLLIFVLAACQPLPPVTPASSPSDAPTAAPTEAPDAIPGDALAPEAVREIPVLDVAIDVGVGSPIPVDAFVSGQWPDLCAQIAEIRQRLDGYTFEITLLASDADPACPPDNLGLPFRIAIPLNVVELPEGTYTVTVNGFSTTFEVPVTPRDDS